MAAKTNKGKGIAWILLYVFTGLVDLVQIIITFTGIGIIVSEALEAAMPFVLIPTLQFLMKVSLFSHPARLLSIVGATGLDAITGGVAPFWVVDVWYIQRSVRAEDAQNQRIQEQNDFIQQNISQPLYKDGRRNPEPIANNNSVKPLVMDGIRAPGGGMTTNK